MKLFGNLYINSCYTFGLNHPAITHLDMSVTDKTFITNMPS